MSFIRNGGLERKNAEAAYLVNGEDADDFIMVSSRGLLTQILRSVLPTERGFNIGLQKPSKRDDNGKEKNLDETDGYLSVYAAQNGIRYIIVEAEHEKDGEGDNHEARQAEIVTVIIRALNPK